MPTPDGETPRVLDMMPGGMMMRGMMPATTSEDSVEIAQENTVPEIIDK